MSDSLQLPKILALNSELEIDCKISIDDLSTAIIIIIIQCYIVLFLQNFGYIPLFKQVCIKFIPLFRWTHFSVSFSTSRKIHLKFYILDKKDIIKQ